MTSWFRKMETYLGIYTGDKEVRRMISAAQAALNSEKGR